MKRGFIILTCLLMSSMGAPVYADAPVDVNDRIEMMERQMQIMQNQLQELKDQASHQAEEKEELVAKIEKLESEPATFLAKGLQGGTGFKLQDALGLEEESWLNISGEVSVQYKQAMGSGSGSSEGFRGYELPEIFWDATLGDNVSVFAETILAYEGGSSAIEDVWIDLHLDKKLAATGNTGLKIGQFHLPFGWDNDDNEGYAYGGRTSVDSTYVRSQRIEKKRLREREIGIQANYNIDVAGLLDLDVEDPFNVIFSGAVLNGAGPMGSGSEWDNDNERDFAGRVEIHALNGVIGGSLWNSPATNNFTGTDTAASKTRDVFFKGAHFKYPDVPFPNQDITLGGSKFLLWGEYIWGKAEEANVAGEGNTKVQGSYCELDVPINSKLLAFARQDFYDPDTETGNNGRGETTVGVMWQLLDNCQLIVNYVDDNFKDTTEADHVGMTFKAKF